MLQVLNLRELVLLQVQLLQRVKAVESTDARNLVVEEHKFFQVYKPVQHFDFSDSQVRQVQNFYLSLPVWPHFGLALLVHCLEEVRFLLLADSALQHFVGELFVTLEC